MFCWGCFLKWGFSYLFWMALMKTLNFPPNNELIRHFISIKKLFTIFPPQNQLQFRIFPFKSGRSNNVINYFPSDKMETISKLKFLFFLETQYFLKNFLFSFEDIFRSFREWNFFNWTLERFSGGLELNVSKVGNLIKVFPVFLKNSFKDFDFLKIVGKFLKFILKKTKIRR